MAFYAAPPSSGRIVPRVTIERVTPLIPRVRPNVKHAITAYLRLPRPTPAHAVRVLHWLRCWAEEPGTPLAIRPKIMARYERLQLPLDDCCRLVSPYNAVHNIQQTEQIPNDTPRMGAESTTTNNHPSTPRHLILWVDIKQQFYYKLTVIHSNFLLLESLAAILD